MTAYYNEHDPYAAQWLRNLIEHGLIADGDVDERDIQDVRPSDLKGYSQCHFFAGIGGWSYALRLAGVPDDYPIWTGSPPCQPFSQAGKQAGKSDKRHLWPVFFHLIRECKPAIVFGEQVESAIAHGWLDDLYTDMEGEGYACGSTIVPACGVGAPHIRQRLFWVGSRPADSRITRLEGRNERGDSADQQLTGPSRLVGGMADSEGERNDRTIWNNERKEVFETVGRSGDNRMADATSEGSLSGSQSRIYCGKEITRSRNGESERPCSIGWVGQPDCDGRIARKPAAAPARHRSSAQSAGGANRASPLNGFWSNSDWLFCKDNKWRSVEPGTFPLVNGLPAAVDGLGSISRVGALKGAGNAIVPQVAQVFIESFFEAIGEMNEYSA